MEVWCDGYAGCNRQPLEMPSEMLDSARSTAREEPRRAGAMLLVTSRGFYKTGHARRALAAAVPGAHIRGSRFGGVLLLEAEGDPLELARRVSQQCSDDVGRVIAVCAQVPTSAATLRESAVCVGAERIAEDDSFCFRIRKRGAHALDESTAALEREIGGAILVALERKYGHRPRVDLENPDVAIRAEVLGPIALVGVQRRDWGHCEAKAGRGLHGDSSG